MSDKNLKLEVTSFENNGHTYAAIKKESLEQMIAFLANNGGEESRQTLDLLCAIYSPIFENEKDDIK